MESHFDQRLLIFAKPQFHCRVQEIAFTFSCRQRYRASSKPAPAAGLQVDDFAPRISFFFNAHNNFLEEIAKFRAARRLYARLMRERFGAVNPRSCMLRFHTQTAGSTLTAQQPDVNIVRTALQALAGVLGGTQSLHTNSRDEALSLPTEESARIALRTQQIIAYETGVTNTVDPVGGSEHIEDLTDRIEAGVQEYLAAIDDMGGAVVAIEKGNIQTEIQNSAFDYQRSVESGEQIIVGVNRFQMAAEQKRTSIPFRLDPRTEQTQIERLRGVRAGRDQSAVEDRLRRLKEATRGPENLMPSILDAAEHYATVEEISDAMRSILGEYRAGM